MPLLRPVLCTAVFLAAAAPLQARQLKVTDTEVGTLLQQLDRRSPTAHRMLEAMRLGRIPVVIGTATDLTADMTRLSEQWDPRARRAVGLMAAVFAPGTEQTRVGSIMIAIDVERIGEIFAVAGKEPSDVPWERIRREELLAVLGHEISHAYGLVSTEGDIAAQCDDPPEGGDPMASCVIVAENLIRADLGIPLDWGYGMPTPSDMATAYTELAEHQATLLEISRRTTRSLRSFVPLGAR